MTAKKAEEVLPVGSVQVESVRNLEGFDPFANIPEVATWRNVESVDVPAVVAPKPDAKPAAKKEN